MLEKHVDFRPMRPQKPLVPIDVTRIRLHGHDRIRLRSLQ
jgi:hypothetical protein